MSFSRGESIALWTGVILFIVFLSCIFWRLCSVTCKTMFANMTGRKKGRKRLNPMEKKVNKILSNESAREILKAHALTAINSQENKRQRGYSSQVSLDSVGSVPDLTDRVIRVSFAPTGDTRADTGTGNVTSNMTGNVTNTTDETDNTNIDDQASVSTLSIGK